MSQEHNLQPKQLSMFMTAGELKKLQPNPHDMRYQPDWMGDDFVPYASRLHEDSRSFWQQKDEDLDPSFVKSVKDVGVKAPVNLYHPDQGEERYMEMDVPLQSHELGPGEKYGDTRFMEVDYPLKGTTIVNGHHRIAAADRIDPDTLIPVVHFDSSTGSWNDAVWGSVSGNGFPAIGAPMIPGRSREAQKRQARL